MMDLFTVFFRNSVFAGVMILAVLAVRPLLRKAPRNICCLLWLLVALRLLLPFQLESPLSLQPDVFEEPEQITVIVETDPPSKDPIPLEPPVIDIPQQLPSETPVASAPRFQWETALPVLWIYGTLSLLIYSAVSYGVLKRRVWDAVLASDGAWESDRIEGAFLLGYFFPKVYIPVGLQPQDRAFILAHERSHLHRGDHWWKLLGMLCLSIHWYNPLVWLSYALLCRDIETACDERVIRTMELEQRRAYSFALLNSGKRMSGFLAYPVAFGEISLKQRIKNVLSYRKPGIWVTLVAVICAAVIVVCFMTGPDTPEPDTVQDPPVTDVQPETTQPATVTTLPTEPVTEPTVTATEPAETATVATEPATTPTEPIPTEPEPTKPEPTQPKPTEPPVTKPQGPRVIAEGKWGGRTPWKITSDGVLTLSGERHIDGTSSMWFPWFDYKDQVTKIVITDGITEIPSHAFYGMHKVTEVSIPDSVVKVGRVAFWDCFSLRTVTIPPKVKELEHGVFFFCTSLRSVNFAAGCSLETIGPDTFSDSALEEIIFLGDAPQFIDETAFRGVTATAYYPADNPTWTQDKLQQYEGHLTWVPIS